MQNRKWLPERPHDNHPSGPRKGISFAVAAAAFADDTGTVADCVFHAGMPRVGTQEDPRLCRGHGFAAIELRGLQGNLDLPSHPAFAVDQIEQTKRDISAHGLKMRALVALPGRVKQIPGSGPKNWRTAGALSSCGLTGSAVRARVRGRCSRGERRLPGEELQARVTAGLHELGEYAGRRNVTVIIESHDNFTASATLSDVLRRAASEHVALLWTHIIRSQPRARILNSR